jgi:hypothetical protein
LPPTACRLSATVVVPSTSNKTPAPAMLPALAGLGGPIAAPTRVPVISIEAPPPAAADPRQPRQTGQQVRSRNFSFTVRHFLLAPSRRFAPSVGRRRTACRAAGSRKRTPPVRPAWNPATPASTSTPPRACALLNYASSLSKSSRVHYFYCTVALIKFASSMQFAHKSAPNEKIRRSKNSRVSYRESNSLSDTVEFFSIAVFFRGALL